MKIKWNGHSSFTIIASDGTTIITDPYKPGGSVNYGPIPDKADIATVSHEHLDHNYPQGLAGAPQVIKESKTVKGIEFVGVPLYHDDAKGTKRGKNTVFVFSVDGVRICHLGDLGHTLSKDDLKKIGKVDVMFLPIGGFFTIDPNQATRVMEDLNPRVVFPMHFRTEKCDLPIAKLDDFIHGKESATKRLKTSDVEISANSLPSSREIWVLPSVC